MESISHIVQTRQKQDLDYTSPLKVQYRKMKKEENIKAVRDELRARNIEFALTNNWKTLLTLLKDHEGDSKYFKPVIAHGRFITNDAQIPQ